ncbi:unnamed protein product [Phytophthora fragariaefolia]|uniref:Unnamed protein product n=1 Tax=Phytophthora fragariaefolia TaxID=1490495 RepID=A0A9W6Y054_9STRA|nr:unnamed protein product [Phytophthora fragariaefolia]
MGRSKKKRIREEIEQAMRDNERVNAMPAAQEEPSAIKRRQARRRNKRYNLNKEFQALAVGTAEASTATAALPQVPAAVPPPTPAHIPAAVPTPVLATTSVGEQQRPDTNPDPVRRPRASLTASQQERRRQTEASSQSTSCRVGACTRTEPRGNQPADVRQTVREVDRLRHEQSREQETPDERSARLAREREHQEEHRANLGQQQEEAEQAYRREYQAMQRDARDDEENDEARQNERTRRSTLRRGRALANHEDFRVSMLSGPNIADGRHKLPPTTVCLHWNAWEWPAEAKNACCLEGAVQLPLLAPAPPRLLQLYGDVQFRRLIRAYNQGFAFTSIGASCSNRSFNEVNQDESVAGQHGVQTSLPRSTLLPDMQQRAERRRGIFADLDPGTLLDIKQMVIEVNPFAQQFLNFAERLRQDQMSLREHVAYRLNQKVDDHSVLHQGGRLFQQYCVDQRAKCDQEQLRWIATHQAELRADQYCGFQDAILSETTVELGEGEALLSEYNRETGTLQQPDQLRRRSAHFLNLDQIGRRVVLPSTHPGGPRHMFKSYQDAMAVVREFGKPDVFVTMTCSPMWDEIQQKIPDENQSAQDRPDVVARVYQMKLAALLKDLDEGVLGRVQARIYVVEFQKRGFRMHTFWRSLQRRTSRRSSREPDRKDYGLPRYPQRVPLGYQNQTLGSPQTIPSRAWEDGSRVAKAHGAVLFARLLCHRKGPQSSEHLRTVAGVTYETYREAALRLGFLEDDAEWISCMREAAEFRMPYQLRQLFTTNLVYAQVAEVRQLWERFYDDPSQDFAHRYRALLGQEKDDMIKFKTLKSLNGLLQISGYAVADFDLPRQHDFPALQSLTKKIS